MKSHAVHSPITISDHAPQRSMHVDRRVNNPQEPHRTIALEHNESAIIALQELRAEIRSMYERVTAILEKTKSTNSRLDYIGHRDRRKGGL